MNNFGDRIILPRIKKKIPQISKDLEVDDRHWKKSSRASDTALLVLFLNSFTRRDCFAIGCSRKSYRADKIYERRCKKKIDLREALSFFQSEKLIEKIII